MIGLLLISHGKMAEGMLDSLHLIMGECEQIRTASLVAGQDFENFKQNVISSIESLDTGEGVLVFVDLFGASPCNATQYAMLKLKEKNIKVRTITGMNLPMLLETAAMRYSSSLEEVWEIARKSGREGICEPVIVQDEEDDGDY